MRTLRRKYILLGAIALLVGALAPMAVTASEYDRIGAVAKGVYDVQADDDRFRIEAEQATEALIYAPNGDLIVAKHIPAGERHDFIVNDGRAIVALFEGEAVVKAKGEGSVTELPVQTERIDLVEADGEAVDRTITIQLPDMLVGVGGGLEGDASNLLVEATTEQGTVFRASQQDIEHNADALAEDALHAGVLDVHVSADSLDGTVIAALSTVELPSEEELDEHTHETEVEEEDLEGIEIHNATERPLVIDAPEGATLAFDVEGGHMLDASLYAEDGSQAFYTHLGPELERMRGGCQDAMDCGFWYYNDGEHVEEQEIETELPAGTYLLFVRAGYVDGLLTITSPSGEDLLEDAEEPELTYTEYTDDETVTFESPVLDIRHSDWSVDAFKALDVSFANETAFSYWSTVSAGGFTVDSDTSYDPSLLTAGEVDIDFDGMVPAFGQQGHAVWLLTLE